MAVVTEVQNFKLILLCFAISLWLYWLWTRRHLYWFSMRFPGLWGVPLLGLIYRITSLESLLPVVKNFFAESKHNTICIWLGTYPVILTQEPEFIGKVLSSRDLLNKSKGFYQCIYKFFQGGLIASPVEEWLHNRKLINPAFSHKVLECFFPVFNKAKSFTISKFDALVGQGEQKLLDMLQRVALGITVETTMGKVMEEGNEVDEDLVEKWQFLVKNGMAESLLSSLHLDTFLSFISPRIKYTKQYLRNHTNELLAEKIKSSEENHNDHSSSDNFKQDETGVVSIKKPAKIFVEQAIRLYKKQQFTRHDMQSESNTIVAAAFETTSNSTFAALVMLAMHSEVQEKLYQEIVSVFPDKVFEMEYSHIEQLPYLDMVVKEVLRLNPAVPLIGRHVAKETQLTKDILLPEDLQIIISIFHLHRRTDIWGPNAEQFDPDNFLPENIKDKHSHAYIPFSMGNRNCIGWRYALFAVKVLLAGFVRNFRFTTTFKYKDLRYVDNITLYFVDEPLIEIHRR